MTEVFLAAQKLLSTLRDDSAIPTAVAGGGAAAPGLMSEAQELLLKFGYVELDEANGLLRGESRDPAVASNRLALFRLASRFERLFSFQAQAAPFAWFLGGEIDPAAFGLSSPGGGLSSASGKGAAPGAAFEACMGEAAEHLSYLAWGDEPCFEMTVADLLAGAHARWMLNGIGLDEPDPHRRIDCLIARGLDGTGDIRVPAELCIARPARPKDRRLRVADSNGCAAGRSLYEAAYRGLLELVERDAAALWWFGGRRAPEPDLGDDGRARLGEFVAKLRGDVLRRHWCLDLTSDIGIPVVAALSCDDDGRGIVFGFAADIDPLQAAEGAVLEMCQMELAQDLTLMKVRQRGRGALNASDSRHLQRREQLRIDGYPQLTPLSAAKNPNWPIEGTGRPAVEVCTERLGRAGLKAYCVDLTRQEIGIPVARVVVPGLQSAKPDWLSARLEQAARENRVSQQDWKNTPPLI